MSDSSRFLCFDLIYFGFCLFFQFLGVLFCLSVDFFGFLLGLGSYFLCLLSGFLTNFLGLYLGFLANFLSFLRSSLLIVLMRRLLSMKSALRSAPNDVISSFTP